jgi:hypothetical protein
MRYGTAAPRRVSNVDAKIKNGDSFFFFFLCRTDRVPASGADVIHVTSDVTYSWPHAPCTIAPLFRSSQHPRSFSESKANQAKPPPNALSDYNDE